MEQRSVITTPGGISVATLVAGTVNVSFPAITATSIIIPAPQNVSGVAGNISFMKNPGVGFDINSDSALDTRIIGFIVTQPV